MYSPLILYIAMGFAVCSRSFKILTFQTTTDIISATLLISLFISRGYIDRFLREHQQNNLSVTYQVFHNKKLFFSYLLLGAFYFHFFCSVYCTINNYLSYVYIFDHENPLINISRSYIESMHIGVKNYYIYSQVTIAFICFAYTVFKIKRIASEAYVSVYQEHQKSN